MKKIKLTLSLFIIISIGIYSQNTEKKWGYFLQIVDNNYIPQIENTDGSGYITLHTGIATYDAIFAKYKITEFYQYAPTSTTEWIRQTYCLVCDSGQVELGEELNAKYSNIIPYLEIFYMTPILSNLIINKTSNDCNIIIQSNRTIKLTGFTGQTKEIHIYNLKGELLYSKKTNSDIIDCEKLFSKGIILYQIITNHIKKSGMTIIL